MNALTLVRPEPVDDVRARLADAIGRLADATTATAEAAAVLDGAKRFLRQVEGEIADAGDVEAEVATARANAIKSALAAGRAPSFELSPELTAATVAKAEAENQLQAARQAAALLAVEHSDFQLAEAEARRCVDLLITDVLVDEADALAAELFAAEDVAAELHNRLSAIGGLMVPGGNGLIKLADLHHSALRVHASRDNNVVRNTPAWRRAGEIGEILRRHVADLRHCAAAQPDFDGFRG
jgi:hypothetical protein